MGHVQIVDTEQIYKTPNNRFVAERIKFVLILRKVFTPNNQTGTVLEILAYRLNLHTSVHQRPIIYIRTLFPHEAPHCVEPTVRGLTLTNIRDNIAAHSPLPSLRALFSMERAGDGNVQRSLTKLGGNEVKHNTKRLTFNCAFAGITFADQMMRYGLFIL